MALVVQVPYNTVLADLDEGSRALFRRELDDTASRRRDAFDAPSSDWAGQLTGPAVNLFLYDLREFSEGQDRSPTETRDANGARMTPPPLRLEVTFAITAWTQAVEDEHRLLSQVLAVRLLSQHPADVSATASPTTAATPSRAPSPAGSRRRPTSGPRSAALQGLARLGVRVTVDPAPSSPAAPRSGRISCAPASATLPPGAVSELHRFAESSAAATTRRSPTRGSRCPTPGAGRQPTARAVHLRPDRPGQHHSWRARSTAARWKPTSRSPDLPWTS